MERDFGEAWKKELSESMAKAGMDERRLAEESGEFHHRVPAITVIVDGGWSKRCHKHSYSVNSGVGIIIGKRTGKLLDSSVYPTLVQNVPVWGHDIRKLDCVNHACKCYCGALERLVQENPSYKGSSGLSQKMRGLVSAASSAVRMRSMEDDKR